MPVSLQNWQSEGLRVVSAAMLCIATLSTTAALAAPTNTEDAEAVAAARERPSRADQVASNSDVHIRELIHQLGSTQFTVRREAASELQRIGSEAFDQLRVATDDSDPEIAASARYLMRQIVHWTRAGDSVSVRRLLHDYGDMDENERKRRIGQLSD